MAEKEFNGECRLVNEGTGEELVCSYKLIYTTEEPIQWSSLISVNGKVVGAPKGKIENFRAGIADIEPVLRELIETNIVEFAGIDKP